jgi:hypothetical protein
MNKKMLVVGVAVAVLLGVGGAAFAYFTSTGTGNGTAGVATAQKVTISQIGAGYDSLIAGSGDPYIQDQCFNCSGPKELGNDITLANPGSQQLVSVVVAMRNWGGAVSSLPITLTLYNPAVSPEVAGNVIASDTTQTFSFAANNADGSPSVTNITFDFPQGTSVPQEFVYDIAYGSGGPSLNVALSSSANDLTVGTDTTPGSIWMNDTNGNNNDFPTCITGLPTTGFAQIYTNCGPYNPANPGAYGTAAEVIAGSADIPAVEFNVVGGATASLWPGDTQNIDFAITNPNPGSVYLSTVTIALKNNGTDVENQYSTAITGCHLTWFSVTGSPVSIAANVAPGVTDYTGLASITMTNANESQDACQGATIGLTFTSP